jgi:hypothetical protein
MHVKGTVSGDGDLSSGFRVVGKAQTKVRELFFFCLQICYFKVTATDVGHT